MHCFAWLSRFANLHGFLHSHTHVSPGSFNLSPPSCVCAQITTTNSVAKRRQHPESPKWLGPKLAIFGVSIPWERRYVYISWVCVCACMCLFLCYTTVYSTAHTHTYTYTLLTLNHTGIDKHTVALSLNFIYSNKLDLCI